jgi:hypothetical protein
VSEDWPPSFYLSALHVFFVSSSPPREYNTQTLVRAFLVGELESANACYCTYIHVVSLLHYKKMDRPYIHMYILTCIWMHEYCTLHSVEYSIE